MLLLGMLSLPGTDADRDHDATVTPIALRITRATDAPTPPSAAVSEPRMPTPAPPLLPPQTAVPAPPALATPPTPTPTFTPDRLPTPAATYTPPSFADLALVDASKEQYLQDLGRWLRQHQIYPQAAREQGLEGLVVLVVNLNRAGEVLAVSIGRSSGEPLLDKGALDTLLQGGPLPPVPAALPYATLEMELTVSFRLNDRQP